MAFLLFSGFDTQKGYAVTTFFRKSRPVRLSLAQLILVWIPAFAGMTGCATRMRRSKDPTHAKLLFANRPRSGIPKLTARKEVTQKVGGSRFIRSLTHEKQAAAVGNPSVLINTLTT